MTFINIGDSDGDIVFTMSKSYCRSVQLVHLRMSVDLMKPFVIVALLMTFHIVPHILLFEVSLKFV